MSIGEQAGAGAGTDWHMALEEEIRMSFFGWDNIKDSVMLQGFVAEAAHLSNSGGDHDWCVKVAPAAGFTYLLTNPDGYTNKENDHSWIECEIKPPDKVNGVATATDAAVAHGMDLPENEKVWVTIVGAWIRDRSHSYNGKTIVPSDPLNLPTPPIPGMENYVGQVAQNIINGVKAVANPIGTFMGWVTGGVEQAAGLETDYRKGKTEIHPIYSILAEFPPTANNRSRKVNFMAFSDAKNLDPIQGQTAYTLPHGDESHDGEFTIPIMRGGTATKSQEQDASLSHLQLTITNALRDTLVIGKVTSGTVSEGKGFYRVTLTLPGFTLLTFLASRNLPTNKGILKIMKSAKVKSVRALFNHLEAGTLPMGA